jgi:hypothetical protein
LVAGKQVFSIPPGRDQGESGHDQDHDNESRIDTRPGRLCSLHVLAPLLTRSKVSVILERAPGVWFQGALLS